MAVGPIKEKAEVRSLSRTSAFFYFYIEELLTSKEAFASSVQMSRDSS
jgi:hypothetical protein